MKKELHWHINEDGLSNKVVKDFVKQFVPNKNVFLGVYSSRKLPIKRILQLAKKSVKKFAFIINVGAHFVATIICSDTVLYIDSLAGRLWNSDVKSLLSAVISSLPPGRDGKKRKKKKRQLYINQQRWAH